MNRQDIRAARKRMVLTQEAFARRIGVSLLTVSRWERGSTRPTGAAASNLLDAIADAPARGPSGERGRPLTLRVTLTLDAQDVARLLRAVDSARRGE